MLLDGRTAIIYGAGGAIGGAVARAFAREGAKVHLVGRTPAALEVVATDIRSSGGLAETAILDALDGAAVDAHADGVAASDGRIDVSMNLVAHGDVHGTPLAEMALEDFERPVRLAVRTTFLTTRAAARHMIRQRSGVLLMFGGEGDPMRDYYIGGTQVAFHAIEALRRQLAAELGPHGVRVLTLQTGGIPDSLPHDMAGRAEVAGPIVAATMIKRATTLADVGAVAVFAVSDLAQSMTGTALNISAGAIVN